jgi:hypothetical protein
MMKKLTLMIFLITTDGLSDIRFINTARTVAANPAQAFNWQGVYRFGEVGGKNTGMVIDYLITVYQKDGILVADLDGDGFQTLLRISCTVKATEHKLGLFFKSYRPDNLFEIYKPDEHLLSLERKNGKVLTYWGAVKPQLTSFKDGRVYFTKQARRRTSGK